jgi:hypothetical protein
MIMLIPIKNIVRSVGVVDENPEMIEEKHGVKLFLNSEEEQNLLRQHRDDTENCHDIVWEVLSIRSWAGEFVKSSRFVSRIMRKQAETAQEEQELPQRQD